MKSEKLFKYSKWLFYFTVISAIYFILNRYGISNLRDSVTNMGLFAPVSLCLLRFTSIIIPIIPSTGFSLLAGAAFGFKYGIIIICIADIFACSISFSLARYYGRNIVRRLTGKSFLHKLEKLNKNHVENNFFFMTGLLMTGMFDFFSYGMGLSKASKAKYFPALITSILLSNPPIVALGSGILDGGKRILVFAILGILFLAFVNSKLKFAD